jgi:hypothetical protein
MVEVWKSDEGSEMRLKDIVKEGWAEDFVVMNQPELENATEQEQLKAIQENPAAIHNLKNPTREMQKIAIEKKPTVIVALKRGTRFDEDMLMLAVSLNGFVISNIENPSEELQLAAVTNHIGAIESIAHPTTAVIKLALTNENNFYHEQRYHAFQHNVKRIFADNAVLMKKWLRYGETRLDNLE